MFEEHIVLTEGLFTRKFEWEVGRCKTSTHNRSSMDQEA